MKHFLGTIMAFCITLITSGQYTLKGHIVNEQNNQSVEAASVSLLREGTVLSNIVSDKQGNFQFKNLRKKVCTKCWLNT